MLIHLGRNLKGSRGTRGLHFHHFAINRARFQRGHDVVADRNDRHRSGDHGSWHLQGCEQFFVDNVPQVVYRNDPSLIGIGNGLFFVDNAPQVVCRNVLLEEGMNHLDHHNHMDQVQYASLQIPNRAIQVQFPHQALLRAFQPIRDRYQH